MIEIKSPTELYLDGELLGAVFDSIANHPLSIPDVQRAFEKYCSDLNQERDLAVDSQQATQAELDKAHAAFVAGDLETIQAMVAEKEKTEKERQIEAATAERDAAIAKLEELTKE